MKWFKHDTSAHDDKKLKRVFMKYGLKGFGFYWYCLEKIGSDISTTKISCLLDADSETLAWELYEEKEWIGEVLDFFVELGLLEREGDNLLCTKMLTRLDRSTSENPEFKRLMGNHASYNGCTEDVQQLPAEEKRKEENTREENKKKGPRFRDKANSQRWSEYKTDIEAVIGAYNKCRNRKLVPATENYVKLLGILFDTGYSADQCKAVIIHRWEEWRSDEKMSKFHRPETLFAYENFQKYLPEALEYMEKKKEVQRPKQKKATTPIERTDPETARMKIDEIRKVL